MNEQDKSIILKNRADLINAIDVPKDVKMMIFDLGFYNDVIRGYLQYAIQIHKEFNGDTLEDLTDTFNEALSELTAEEAQRYYFNN